MTSPRRSRDEQDSRSARPACRPVDRRRRRGFSKAARHARWAAVLAWLVVLGSDPATSLPAAEPIAWDVRIGFADGFRAGAWTPVVVAAPGVSDQAGGAAAGDTVHVWAEDPDGQFVRSPPAPLVSTDGGAAARFCVRVGRPFCRLFVEHVPAGAPLESVAAAARELSPSRPDGLVERVLPDPIPSTHGVLLVLGDLPAARRAARLLSRNDGSPLDVIAVPDATAAARIAAGSSGRDYDGIDAIIVCGRLVSSLPVDVRAGIDDWVRRGGRLVFCAGRSAADVERFGEHAASWLPGRVERFVPLRRMNVIETLARAGGLSGRPDIAGFQVPLLENRGSLPGVVDAFDGSAPQDLPVVVRRGHGLGTITWIGIDVDDEPFRGWQGGDSLLVRLLGGREQAAESSATNLQPTGDGEGRLRIALENRLGAGPAAATAPVPFAIIVGLGLLYIACLYPLDWWLVSHGRGRPGLAWLTLPAIVAAFTAAAWGVAARWRPPAMPAGQAAELVDFDAASGAIRGRSWAALWKPVNSRIDAAVVPEAAGPGQATVSWFADAGAGFAAIDSPVSHPTLAATDYRYGVSLAALAGVPVAAASNRLFVADWFVPGAGPAFVTAALSREPQGTLQGTLAHHLPLPLEDCRLAYGGWLYDIGRLAPGQVHDLLTGRGPRSLAGAFRARDAAATAAPGGVIESMAFHAAASGLGRAAPEAGRLGRLDMSPLLSLDRAVLFGRPATQPSQATWRFAASDGETAPAAVDPAGIVYSTRLYRIVIPLQPSADPPR